MFDLISRAIPYVIAGLVGLDAVWKVWTSGKKAGRTWRGQSMQRNGRGIWTASSALLMLGLMVASCQTRTNRDNRLGCLADLEADHLLGQPGQRREDQGSP